MQAFIASLLDPSRAAMLLMVAGLLLLLLGTLGSRLVLEGRAALGGAGHHCHPGTCPVCDTFGTWAE